MTKYKSISATATNFMKSSNDGFKLCLKLTFNTLFWFVEKELNMRNNKKDIIEANKINCLKILSICYQNYD